MAATTIFRSVWTDGAAPTGTVIRNAVLQGHIYDPIDDLIGSDITFGGTISSEGFGTHLFSVGGTGANTLRIRNTSGGSTNRGTFEAMADGADVTALEHLSGSHTASGSALGNAGRLRCSSGVGFNIDVNELRFYIGSSLRGVLNTADGFLLENSYGYKLKSSSGATVNGATLTGANQLEIGHDTNVGNVIIRCGTSAFGVRTSGADRFVINNSGHITPGANNTQEFGSDSFRWSRLFVGSGSAGDPSISIGDEDTGLYSGSAALNLTIDGNQVVTVSALSGNHLVLQPRAFGTGGTPGGIVEIGRNSSGSGAAGVLALHRRASTTDYLWSDAGTLRISTAQPLENDAVSHSSGTIVGTQTSSRDTKDVIARFEDRAGALRAILETPVYRFRYKPGHGIQGEDFIGIITDESPQFGMDRDTAHPHGKSLNVVNAIGLLISGIQALNEKVDALTNV